MVATDTPPSRSTPGAAPVEPGRGARWGPGVCAAVVVLSLAYAAVLVPGLALLPSADDPIADPWFTAMELLIILSAPVLVAAAVAVHAWAAPDDRPLALLGVVLMGLCAGLTTGVHVVILVVRREPTFEQVPGLARLVSFEWPSLTYLLDVVAWDLFFPLSVLCVAAAVRGSGLAAATRAVLVVSGALSLGGLVGVVLDDMTVRTAVGVTGYSVVFPVGVVLLGVLLHRSTGRPRTA